MQSKATTVATYLASLPADRRAAVSAVRQVILKNLDKDYEECMQYGMIAYCVPHRIFPAGYHCDPSKPLGFAGLASQKQYMSIYLMCVYGDGEHARWFKNAWARSGKKLDMGKCCVRFKNLGDIPLDVIGEAIRRVPVKKYLASYQKALEAIKNRPVKGPPRKPDRKGGPARAKRPAKPAARTK